MGTKIVKNESRIIFASQIFAGVLSLLSVTLTAKYLGPEIFGACSVALSLLIVFMSFADFGGCSWAGRELASGSISDSEFLHIKKSKGKLMLLPMLTSPLVYFLLPNDYIWAILLCLYPLLWNNFNFVQQFLIAKRKYHHSAKLIVVDRMCWLLIIPFSTRNFDKVLSFTIPILSGLAVHALIGDRYLKSFSKSAEMNEPLTNKRIFDKSKNFGLISFFSVLSNLDGIIVASFAGILDSGSYILSQRFRNPMMLIFNSFSIRIRPIAARRDMKQIQEAFKQDTSFLSFGLIGNLFFGLIALSFHSKIFDSDFENLGIVMLFGALTSTCLGLALICSTILTSWGLDKQIARTSGVFSSTLLIGVAIGAFIGGSVGASIWVFVDSLTLVVLLISKIFFASKYLV